MTASRLIGVGGAFGEPASHLRSALLAVAMTLSVVLCAMLLTVRPSDHVIKVGLPTGVVEIWRGPTHRLELDARGRVMIDGVICADVLELRRALDVEMLEVPRPEVQFSPAPDARYEDFVRVLAITKMAQVKGLNIDFDPPSFPPLRNAPLQRHCADMSIHPID